MGSEMKEVTRVRDKHVVHNSSEKYLVKTMFIIPSNENRINTSIHIRNW